MIASRHKILSETSYQYCNCFGDLIAVDESGIGIGGADCYSGKGLLYAKIQKGNLAIHVIVTHMNAGMKLMNSKPT